MNDARQDATANRTDTRALLSMHVDELDLPARVSNCLRRGEITYVADLVRKTPEALLTIQGIEGTSVRDIKRALNAIGLRLAGSIDVGATDLSDEKVASTHDVMSVHIDELDLTVRAYNCLRNAQITCVGDLVRKTPGELLAIQNMGTTSVHDIERALARLGLRLALSSAAVSALRRVDNSGHAQDLEAFIDAMELLKRHGVDHAAVVTGMTFRQVLAVPGFDQDTLAVLENGLQRWGLYVGQRFQDRRAERSSNEDDTRGPPGGSPEAPSVQARESILCLERATTFREELTQAVSRLLAEERGGSPQCFVAYYGIAGEPKRTLREIGDAGSQYGFERAVTRERIRQVLERTESRLRAKAKRVRFVRWEPAEKEARRNVPDSVHSFVSRFGYESVREPEHVFTALKLCAGIFELNFPFLLLKSNRVGTLVVDAADDAVRALVSRLPEVATGPYAELKEVAGQVGCEQNVLRRIIDASSRWEFLDDVRRYFWKRPHLPPENCGVTGNAILTSLCKIFSVTRRATISELARSVARDRILRKNGPVANLPIRVLEGIAGRSGLFDVDRDDILRKKGLQWCVIGQRDIALLAICVEHGRVVPSHVIYAGLVRSGLTRENAAITVAYSPFLVHTQSGVGYKEGIYKFVVRPEHIDLDALNARVEESGELDGAAKAEESAGASDRVSATETYLRIPVSSRTRLSGRFFSAEPVGLDGEWDVRDRAGIDIGQITVSGRTVSGLVQVIAALRLEKGDVLRMWPDDAGTLVAGS